MKTIIVISLITSLCHAGRFGIGFAGGGEYNRNYETVTVDELQTVFYGAEFRLQAEALPCIYMEPSIKYLNNPSMASTAAGVGLGINIQPKIGRFPIVPSFGVEGTLLLYNNLSLSDVMNNGNLADYIETAHPRIVGSGFAGLNLFLGQSVSVNCHYRYLSFAPQQNVEMVWAGLSYYFNW